MNTYKDLFKDTLKRIANIHELKYDGRTDKISKGQKSVKFVLLKSSDIKTNVNKKNNIIFVNKRDVRRYRLLRDETEKVLARNR